MSVSIGHGEVPPRPDESTEPEEQRQYKWQEPGWQWPADPHYPFAPGREPDASEVPYPQSWISRRDREAARRRLG